MILLLASQVCCFFLPEDSGYVNLKHDSEIENILRERDIVAEGEFETNRCDVGLQQFFSYVLEAGEKQKETFKKQWHYAHQHLSFNVGSCNW